MDSDPAVGLLLSQITTGELVIANMIIVLLILCSALMSASEIAYFSISNVELDKFRDSSNSSDARVARLLDKPRYLLSTILVTNNLVNIGVVVTSYFVTHGFFDMMQLADKVYFFNVEVSRYAIEFVWNVIIVTFFLVLFGEATPKVFATQNKIKIARVMSPVFVWLNRVLSPLNYVLVSSTRVIEKRLKRYNAEIDIEEINKAIEITVEKKESKQDAKLLKGIVHFGNIMVKQVMRPRTEVAALDYTMNFKEVLEYAKNIGYSRLPVYEDNLDRIKGVLNIKDLLGHIYEAENFEWQQLVREPLFVPETKKIDDLLREIQQNRKHLAIVVDEYGGTSGIITLEDIIEEVLGDIKDEFDETNESEFKKIDNHNFLFDGKTSLIDACQLMEVSIDVFDDVKGEAETLGGLVLEIAHHMPRNGEEIKFDGYKFTVISVNNNRIEKIKVTHDVQ